MYQLNPLADASKLASLIIHWPIARAQRPDAKPRRHTSYLRLALVQLANLATLRTMPGSRLGTARRHDPSDPQNW